MEPSCVRQTSIPGTTKLYGDYLYHYDRVSEFFPHSYADLDGLERSARALEFPEARRAQLVEALRIQNGAATEQLDKLARPGTVAVVTGQQVGLFSGPAYTIFKALTAVRLAAELDKRGVPTVPVFWLATEDHDLAEVDHAWFFNPARRPVKIGVKPACLRDVPVGTVELNEVPVAELGAALEGLPFGAEVLEQLTSCYRAGETFGGAFGQYLGKVLAGFPLLYLDPLQPAVRAMASPLLAEVALRLPELSRDLRARSTELEKAGYHSQVHVDAGSSLLFHLHDGQRTALRWKDDSFSYKDKSFTAAQLAERAEELSPNALLRPVMQDFMLPTVAYVAGPAETAYFAQSEVLYRRLLGRMPVIYPRNSFTLLDERATKLMEKYEMQLPDLLHPQAAVREAIGARLIPQELRGELLAGRASVAGTLAHLRERLLQFDPTLAAAAQKCIAKISFQVEKLANKTARETMRRDKRAEADTDYLMNLVYPQRHLQERLYSIVPFLAQYGPDLPARLYEFTQLSCPDHMVRTV